MLQLAPLFSVSPRPHRDLVLRRRRSWREDEVWSSGAGSSGLPWALAQMGSQCCSRRRRSESSAPGAGSVHPHSSLLRSPALVPHPALGTPPHTHRVYWANRTHPPPLSHARRSPRVQEQVVGPESPPLTPAPVHPGKSGSRGHFSLLTTHGSPFTSTVCPRPSLTDRAA